jgi:hypothetical protein
MLANPRVSLEISAALRVVASATLHERDLKMMD